MFNASCYLLPCRYFTSVLKAAAAKHCGGKLLFYHEGGYSAYYVPFCGLAVIEELSGVTTKVVDPELEEHCKVRAAVLGCCVLSKQSMHVHGLEVAVWLWLVLGVWSDGLVA